MISFIKADIFNSDATFLVNTVNANGVSGKGLALAFKKKYPQMFIKYRDMCKRGEITPGSVTLYYQEIEQPLYKFTRIIANAATKKDWWNPSEYEYVAKCLDNLYDILSKEQYKSVKVRMPFLGCQNGGLDKAIVKDMIIERLSDLPQYIEVCEL